ncbi:ABC transporter substrate-binding protein [Amycolatopsis sp. GM8]|uniref:ABC transporter substrate-binding protein n=1 Tax=Amycolatopsis sp. GM8 TaxID=2896530 RepID=UPI001F22CFCF|nr:ABC transporter substrate-binding protein [Amycolatopsis sp. GM8]
MTTMLAQGLGYYREVEDKFHTKIDLEVQATNTIGQSAFFGNSIDFYQGSIAGLLPPASKGQDVSSIFTHYTGTATIMIGATKYKDSRGTNVSAYNGSHWCFTTLGSNSDLTSRYVAKDAGLDWSKQSAISVGNTGALLPTMQVGRCDIAAMDTNSAAAAIAQGVGYLVQNPLSPANQQRIFGGLVPGLVTWASDKFTSRYPELTQAIVDAQLRAVLFQQQHEADPAQIYAALPKSFTEKTSAEEFAAGWGLFAPGIDSNTGGAEPSQVETSIALGNAVGADVKSVPEKTFDNKFVRQAYLDLKVQVPPSLADK